jgi:hypothetical protein
LAWDETAVGVPLICPVATLSVSPAGKAGEALYWVTAPVTVGDSGVIAALRANVLGLGYARLIGAPAAGAVTAIARANVVLPLVLLAVIVWVLCAAAVAGMPVMTPVEGSNASPAGNAGVTE